MTALLALGVIRVLQAMAAIAVVIWMLAVGLAPEAELGGAFAVLGAVLALPVLGYTAAAVLSVVAMARHGVRGLRVAEKLAVVDLMVGSLLLVGTTRSGVPARSPLLVGVVPLVLGIVTVVLIRRLLRGSSAHAGGSSRRQR